MIWSMIVYFFAVIGVVALLHCIIGWLFEGSAGAGGQPEAPLKTKQLNLREQGGPHNIKNLCAKEGELTRFAGKVKIRTGDYAYDFAEQMKEHRQEHGRGN